MIKKYYLALILAFVFFIPLQANGIVEKMDQLDLREEYSFTLSDGIKFFYKPNENIVFNEKLTESIKKNKTHLTYAEVSKMHLVAQKTARKEVEFKKWDSNTSIAPMIFDTVIFVKNTGKTNLINKRFLVDIKMKRGQLKEDPLIFNKREVLTKTAKWYFYKSYNYTLPVLAPNEIGEIRVKNICLTDMMIDGYNIWPEALSISVREINENEGLSKEYLDYKILELNPNKFQVLPFWH